MPIDKVFSVVDDTHCPDCGGSNLSWNGFQWYSTNSCYNNASCLDCEATFTVDYAVVPITIIQELMVDTTKL